VPALPYFFFTNDGATLTVKDKSNTFLQEATMYLDNMTTLAIIIALVSTMTMTGIAVYKAHQWEQAYHDIYRVLKMERAAR
jgi:hypothetical protein